MKKTLALVLALLLALGCCAALAEKEYVEDSPEWVAALGEAQGADQLFVVAGVGDTTAYISMHEKDADGSWKTLVTTPGYIGKVMRVAGISRLAKVVSEYELPRQETGEVMKVETTN